MKSIISILLILFFLNPFNNLTAQKSNRAIINIHIEEAEEGESIGVWQYSFNLRTPETRLDTLLIVHNKQISLRFEQMNHPGYFSLYSRKRRSLTPLPYLVEPGDSVHIIISDKNTSFSGRGYLKMQCSYQMLLSKDKSANSRPRIINLTDKHIVYNHCDSALTAVMKVLDSYRNKISQQAFEILRADELGFDLNYRLEISGFDLYAKADAPLRIVYQSLYNRLNQLVKKPGNQPNDKMAAYSYHWPGAILKKYLADSFYMQSKPFDLPVQYRYIQHHYKGLLRDHLITYLLHNFNHASDSLVPCIKNALEVVQDNELNGVLRKQYLHYLQGTKAFNFSLRDTSGRLVRLTDFSNKTIVMDFWFTGCLSCVGASAALKPIEHLFKEREDLVFLSISIDRDKNTWLKGLNSGQYSAQGRINLYTDQKGGNHPLIKYYNIFGYPTLMLIDKKGDLVSARLPDPRTNNGTALIKAIKDALDK